jgi:hypothetical protein
MMDPGVLTRGAAHAIGVLSLQQTVGTEHTALPPVLRSCRLFFSFTFSSIEARRRFKEEWAGKTVAGIFL